MYFQMKCIIKIHLKTKINALLNIYLMASACLTL